MKILETISKIYKSFYKNESIYIFYTNYLTKQNKTKSFIII